MIPLASSVTTGTPPSVTITIVVVGALGTLALHLFLLITKSVADSQTPRIELLRMAIEEFNEFAHAEGISLREYARSKKLDLLNPGSGENLKKMVQSLEKGQKKLNQATGHMMALGYTGLADQMRAISDSGHALVRSIEMCTMVGEVEKTLNKARAKCLKDSDAVMARMAECLREESLLGVSFRRYFRWS